MIFDSIGAAEHWIHTQGRPWPGPSSTPPASGWFPRRRRALRFPCASRVVGTLPLSGVLSLMNVRLLGGGPVDPAVLLDTRDFVRPLWNDDLDLMLTVMPAGEGIVVPFETRHPTRCCAAH